MEEKKSSEDFFKNVYVAKVNENMILKYQVLDGLIRILEGFPFGAEEEGCESDIRSAIQLLSHARYIYKLRVPSP